MAIQDTISGQDFSVQKESTLLKRTLMANEIFSAVSGLVALFFSKQVTDFLGIQNSSIFLFLGIGLLVWAGFTAWVMMRPEVNPTLVKLVIAGDLLWVAGTVLLLIFAGGLFTTGGKWAIAIVADIVAAFAILQWIGLRRIQRT